MIKSVAMVRSEIVTLADGFEFLSISEDVASRLLFDKVQLYAIHNDGSDSEIESIPEIASAIENGEKVGIELGMKGEYNLSDILLPIFDKIAEKSMRAEQCEKLDISDVFEEPMRWVNKNLRNSKSVIVSGDSIRIVDCIYEQKRYNNADTDNQ